MDYDNFIKTKTKKTINTGHEPGLLNDNLFDFQNAIVKWAVKKGRAAIFADTGLGKTLMQLSWAFEVDCYTKKPVLILAPLAVSDQTIEQGKKFGIDIEKYCGADLFGPHIYITNYEQMDHVDFDSLGGLVLDESSILKSHTGKIRTKLIELSQSVPYRLSCTATPSPNDFDELGNQCEFLGIMSRTEMLATYFVNDTGDTGTWRLKGWGATKFWQWMATWSVVLRNPSDIGFNGENYILPDPEYYEHVCDVENNFGDLFAAPAMSLTDRRRAQRDGIEEKCIQLSRLVLAEPSEPWLIWCNLNDEADFLQKLIPGSVNVQGSDSNDKKIKNMMDFTHGNIRVLISKPKICGFGMNWQHCARMAFVGIDDSFEKFYQAVRRCHRFGQKRTVQVHIYTSEAEGQMLSNLKRKEIQHNEMSRNMAEHMGDFIKQEISGTVNEKIEYSENEYKSERFTIHLSDCVKLASKIESNSIDYSIFSPPFADLFTYSNSDFDMGNCRSDSEFMGQFKFLVSELFRIIKPGHNVSFHCMNLPTTKMREGYIGLRDFRGDLIRCFQDAGFIYHSEVCIWKDPVVAMQRTKALGLLHKTIRENATMSRMGLPDYVVTMRKPGEIVERVTHGEDLPVALWQKYASPIWDDIDQGRTLNRLPARSENDEKHMCPLQLDVIERCIHLWTNKNDLIFSPFTGIGSEGFCAVKMDRRFIGSELKKEYYELAIKNINDAASFNQKDMFAA